MEQEKRVKLRNYVICFVIEALITLAVIWSKGFLTHSKAVNLQILADAFFVSGIMMTLFAGLVFVSSEGALIGIGFVMRNVVLAFIPMGRTKWERYGDYRARKMEQIKERNHSHIIVTGLIFLTVGIILNLIWYKTYYQV